MKTAATTRAFPEYPADYFAHREHGPATLWLNIAVVALMALAVIYRKHF